VEVGEAVRVGLGVEVGAIVGVLDGSAVGTGDNVSVGEGGTFVGVMMGAVVQAAIINNIIKEKHDLIISTDPLLMINADGALIIDQIIDGYYLESARLRHT
jgi:hypothetical protein